jgi:hypothetical protein
VIRQSVPNTDAISIPFDSPQIPAKASNGETGRINAGKKAIARNKRNPLSIRISEKYVQQITRNSLLFGLRNKSIKKKQLIKKTKKTEKYMVVFFAYTVQGPDRLINLLKN